MSNGPHAKRFLGFWQELNRELNRTVRTMLPTAISDCPTCRRPTKRAPVREWMYASFKPDRGENALRRLYGQVPCSYQREIASCCRNSTDLGRRDSIENRRTSLGVVGSEQHASVSKRKNHQEATHALLTVLSGRLKEAEVVRGTLLWRLQVPFELAGSSSGWCIREAELKEKSACFLPAVETNLGCLFVFLCKPLSIHRMSRKRP